MKIDEGQLQLRIRELKRTGRPEKAYQLQVAIKEGRTPAKHLLYDQGESPEEKEIIGEMPPRTGRGSGKVEWEAFAREHTDWPDELIEGAGGRDDLIKMLELNGIIPKEKR